MVERLRLAGAQTIAVTVKFPGVDYVATFGPAVAVDVPVPVAVLTPEDVAAAEKAERDAAIDWSA